MLPLVFLCILRHHAAASAGFAASSPKQGPAQRRKALEHPPQCGRTNQTRRLRAYTVTSSIGQAAATAVGAAAAGAAPAVTAATAATEAATPPAGASAAK